MDTHSIQITRNASYFIYVQDAYVLLCKTDSDDERNLL